MSERKRILIMTLIMITACLGSALLVITLLYQAELDQTRERLRVTVQSQARLIESVARYDISVTEQFADDPTYDSAIATLAQVTNAHEYYEGFGKTGEFTLARREGDQIVFLLRHRLDTVEQPASVDFESELAEPMRRALNGLSGTVRGLDYRGEMVMAAYEPVAVLDLGLVAKIDVAEIRADFVPVGLYALLASLMLTVASTFLFRRVSYPVIETLSRQARTLENRLEQQKKAEEGLRKATVMLESSIESAKGMIIFALDPEYRYLYFNEAHHYTMKLVYGADIGVGMDILDYITDETDREKAEDYYKRVLSGESFSTVEEWGDIERTFYEILYTPIRDDADEILGITAFSKDVTEQKRVEESREQLLQLNQLILSTAGEGLYGLDLNGNTTFVNPAAAEMIGWDREDLIGLNQHEISHHTKPDGSPYPAGTCPIYAAYKDGKVHRVDDEVFWRKDGSSFPVEYVSSPMRSPDGDLTGAVVVFNDITERIKHESERLSMERQMLQAQKLESLGVLAGGIAHDFNNLLMTILGNADIARQDLSPHAPARSAIETIATTAHRAAELSKQMLAYSGKGRFVIEPIEMNSFVEEMAHLLEVSISKKAVLKYNFADNLPDILGDATQIRQIIMNLIINASEAIGDRSGVISISTGAQDCDSEYLSATENLSLAGLDEELPEGLYVYLEVADTGCGMNTETQAKLFDPFFTTKFTGRGLGMAAILGIVRGHHGMIKVYSEVNQGTTIKVLFPANEQEASSAGDAAVTAALADWHGEGMILIADDEETVRAISKQYLERLGFEVITAKDGREAIDQFREHSEEIVCVLLDMTMPHVDGRVAFREIRKISKDAHVILCSGYNEQDATQHFVGKGLAGFIQKPYRISELRQVLMDTL